MEPLPERGQRAAMRRTDNHGQIGVSQATKSRPGQILTLPRTRSLSWTAMAVEGSHQLVLALWVGVLVAVASLAVPIVLSRIDDPHVAARTAFEMLSRTGLIGCGAGSFLLLTTLLMHLLAMRSMRGALIQGGLILAMTLLAVGLQIRLAPHLADLLRDDPELFLRGAGDPALGRFHNGLGIYLALQIVQALAGITLLGMGLRRWYRYTTVRSSRFASFGDRASLDPL